jgi:hypothetical protein
MRFVPKPKALFLVKKTPEAAAALLETARAAEVVARATARVGKTGNYRDGMRSTVTETPIGMQGILYNVDYKANWLERGTGPRPDGTVTPAYHTLYNAMRAIGLLTFEV